MTAPELGSTIVFAAAGVPALTSKGMSSQHDDKNHATVGCEALSSADDKNKPSTLSLLELQLQHVIQRHSAVNDPDREKHGFDGDSHSCDYNDEIKTKNPSSRRRTPRGSAFTKQCSERSSSTWESTLVGSATGRSERDLDNLMNVEFEIECNGLRRDSTIPVLLSERSQSRGRADGLMQSITRRFRPPGTADEELSLMSPSQSGSSASGSSEKVVEPTTEDRGLFIAKKVGQMVKNRREAKKTAIDEKLMNQMAEMMSNHKAEIEAMETKLNQRGAAIKTLEKALSLRTESVDELRNNVKLLCMELDETKHQLKKALKAGIPKAMPDKKVVHRGSRSTRRSSLQPNRSKSLDNENHCQLDDEIECEEKYEWSAMWSSMSSRFAQSLEHSNHDDKVDKNGFDGSSPLLSLMHGSRGKVQTTDDDLVLAFEESLLLSAPVHTLTESSRHRRTRLNASKNEDEGHCSTRSTTATSNRSRSLDSSHHNKTDDDHTGRNEEFWGNTSYNVGLSSTKRRQRTGDLDGMLEGNLLLGAAIGLPTKKGNTPKRSSIGSGDGMMSCNELEAAPCPPLRRSSDEVYSQTAVSLKQDLPTTDRNVRSMASRQRSSQAHERSNNHRSLGMDGHKNSTERERGSHGAEFEREGLKDSSRHRGRNAPPRESSTPHSTDHRSSRHREGTIDDASQKRERSAPPRERSTHIRERSSSHSRQLTTEGLQDSRQQRQSIALSREHPTTNSSLHNRSVQVVDGKRSSSERGGRRSGAPPITKPLVPPSRRTLERSLSSSSVNELPTRRMPPPSLSKSASLRYMMRNPIYIDLDDEL